MGAVVTATAIAERDGPSNGMVPVSPAQTTGSLPRMEVMGYLLSWKCHLVIHDLANILDSMIVIHAVICSNVK